MIHGTGAGGQWEDPERCRERTDCVPDWIWEVDLEGIITYSNVLVEALFGYTPEEIVGRNMFDLMPPADECKYRELFAAAIQKPEPIRNVVTRLRAKDTSLKTVEMSCAPIFDETHQLVRFCGITRDITDQLAEQRKAQEVQANFKVLVENSPAAIFIVQDAKVVYMNPRIMELMGYAAEEVIGVDIWKFVHSDDIPWLADYYRRRLAGEQVPTQYIARGVTKGGEIRYFDFRSTLIQHRGAPAVLLNAVDITDQRRAEEALQQSEREYRDLAEKINDWLWQVDENDVYTYASPKSRELMGYEPDEVIGKTPFDFMEPDEAERVAREFHRSKAKREAFVLLENTIVHRDGHHAILETSGEPIFDDQGAFRGYRGIDRDITERKLVERQLQDERNFIATVLDTARALVVVLDNQGRIVGFNRESERMTGYSSDEIRGRFFWDVFLDSEESRIIQRDFAQLRATGAPSQHESHWIAKDGSRRLIAWGGSAMFNEHGKVEYVIGSGIDITERVRAEEALKDSEQRLATIIDFLPDATFATNLEGKLIVWNKAMEELSGVKAEDVLGRGDQEYAIPFYGIRRPMLIDLVVKPDEEIERLYPAIERDGGALTAEVAAPSLKPGGGYIWSKATHLYDAHGNVIGAIETVRDITERKRTEQALQEAEIKYRSLVEETLVGVYLVQDGRFVYVNPRFVEIFGYESPEEIVGRSAFDVVAPADRARVAESVRKRMAGEARSARYVFQAITKDGRVIDAEVHGASTVYNGQPAIIGSLVDITERKRQVEALQDSKERYRRLFEHSPDMVFVISLKGETFTEVNPAVTRVLGYEPDEVLGRTPWDISPEFQPDGIPSREKAQAILERQPDIGSQQFEWVHRHKGGALVDCEVSLVSYKVHGEVLIQAIVRDVTQRKQAEESRRRLERELEAAKRLFYRETILSVTDGKLDICDDADVRPYITNAVLRTEVNNAAEVADARRQAEAFASEHGLAGDKLDLFMIGVGEAITNAIKHGIQGQVFMGADEDRVWVGVSDKGRGIESLILPRATLLRGFSTKPSLGLGYSIMLDVSDHILLNTGEHGTAVVLIKELLEKDLTPLPDRLPDTWESISG